jgi:hypothetical protein
MSPLPSSVVLAGERAGSGPVPHRMVTDDVIASELRRLPSGVGSSGMGWVAMVFPLYRKLVFVIEGLRLDVNNLLF